MLHLKKSQDLGERQVTFVYVSSPNSQSPIIPEENYRGLCCSIKLQQL